MSLALVPCVITKALLKEAWVLCQKVRPWRKI